MPSSSEQDPNKRMAEIEKFTPAFPKSKFEGQVSQLALYTLRQLNQPQRLEAYGEKTLAANPDSIPTLLMMADAYAGDPKDAAKAETYANKVLTLVGPNPDSKEKKSYAGLAHTTLGHAELNQEKLVPAVTDLKAAVALLQDDPQDQQQALFYLGYAYAKQNHKADAVATLQKAAGMTDRIRARQKTCWRRSAPQARRRNNPAVNHRAESLFGAPRGELLLDERVGQQLGFFRQVIGPFEVAVGGGFTGLLDVGLDLRPHGFLLVAQGTGNVLERILRGVDHVSGVFLLLRYLLAGDSSRDGHVRRALGSRVVWWPKRSHLLIGRCRRWRGGAVLPGLLRERSRTGSLLCGRAGWLLRLGFGWLRLDRFQCHHFGIGISGFSGISSGSTSAR